MKLIPIYPARSCPDPNFCAECGCFRTPNCYEQEAAAKKDNAETRSALSLFWKNLCARRRNATVLKEDA